jgi:hypothetical protein
MTITATDIISFGEEKLLEVNYICRTQQVSYCIADFGGNVLMRGDFKGLMESKISVKHLPNGKYTFCIIDGDKLIKAPFLKGQ